MSQPPDPVRRPPARRWPRLLAMLLIFACGGVVGAVAGAVVMRERLLGELRHPEQLADRVMPRLRAQLGLSDEQARRVEEVVRRRHAAMEAIRATSHPRQLAELAAMRREVGELLDEEQRSRWEQLCDSIQDRYLPTRPGPPPADTLFERFDANGDGALTEDEVPPPVWWRLRRADANGDGKVTRGEYHKAEAERRP